MKKTFLIIISIILSFSCDAQMLKRQVIASTGGSYSIDGISIRTTVAQPPGARTFSNSENHLRQGFQQPDECYNLDHPDIAITASNDCFDGNSYDLEYTGEYANIYSFNWIFDSNANISSSDLSQVDDLSFSETGIHTIELELSHGYCLKSDSVTVDVNSSFGLNLSTTDAACNGEEGEASVEVSGGVGPYQYNWGDGLGLLNSISLSPGNYQLLIIDSTGCEFTSDFTIDSPDALEIALETSNEDCNLSNGSASISIEGGSFPYNIQWSNGETDIDSLLSLSADLYYVLVSDENDCTDSVAFTIDESSGIEILDFDTENESCVDVNDGSISITLTSSDGVSILWSNGNENTTSIENLTPDEYTVNLVDSLGCTDALSFQIDSAIPITSSFIVDYLPCEQEQGVIEAIINGGVEPYTIYWYDTNSGQYLGSGSDVNISQEGDYEVQIIDGSDCEDVFPIEILTEDCDIIIPTGISPNGDNINDLWVIQGIEDEENVEVKIFNRWGQIVYVNSDYQNDWDGSENVTNIYYGNELPFGAYFYSIQLTSGQSFTGHITLKR